MRTPATIITIWLTKDGKPSEKRTRRKFECVARDPLILRSPKGDPCNMYEWGDALLKQNLLFWNIKEPCTPKAISSLRCDVAMAIIRELMLAERVLTW
jgi:hypothetical protein